MKEFIQSTITYNDRGRDIVWVLTNLKDGALWAESERGNILALPEERSAIYSMIENMMDSKREYIQ